jgi:integrase
MFFFKQDEVIRILRNADEPYRTFYWLAAELGLRAGEICGLHLEDLDQCKVLAKVIDDHDIAVLFIDL